MLPEQMCSGGDLLSWVCSAMDIVAFVGRHRLPELLLLSLRPHIEMSLSPKVQIVAFRLNNAILVLIVRTRLARHIRPLVMSRHPACSPPYALCSRYLLSTGCARNSGITSRA